MVPDAIVQDPPTPPSRPERIFEAALRALRRTIAQGKSGDVSATGIAAMASAMMRAIDAADAAVVPDPTGAAKMTRQWVSLLAVTAPSRRLRHGMAETLAPMATRLARMEGEDAAIRDNHRQLVEVAKLAAPTELAKRVPIAALAAAQGNIAFYEAFAPESWGDVARSFAGAVQVNPAWKTALALTARTRPMAQAPRHGKQRAPRPAAPPAVTKPSPHAYFKGRIAGRDDVDRRLAQCLADPQQGLREAVRVVETIAAHPRLCRELARHNVTLARRLVKAVRRDPRLAEPLADYAEAIGGVAFGKAGVPPRQLKAVLAKMPEAQAARFARIVVDRDAPRPVRQFLLETDAERLAADALKTLLTSRPAEGYRRVIARLENVADSKVRSRALRPVLPQLVAAIFRDATRDEAALGQFGRLIPMAGGKLRDAGVTALQADTYAQFARRHGRMDLVEMLAGNLAPGPGTGQRTAVSRQAAIGARSQAARAGMGF